MGGHRNNPTGISSAEARRTQQTHRRREVPGLGSSKHREHLVDCQLLATQQRGWYSGLGGEQPCVGGYIQLGAILVAFNDQASEAVARLDAIHHQAGGLQGTLDGGEQLVDGVGGQSEEVEIAGLTLDVAADYQRAATGKSKV
jgi:hypothetical protein